MPDWKSLAGLLLTIVIVTGFVLFSWFTIGVSVEMFGIIGFVGWCVVGFVMLNAVAWGIEV